MRWGIITALAIIISAIFIVWHINNFPPAPLRDTNTPVITLSPSPTTIALVNDIPKDTLTEPVAGFRNRVTKKPFGIFITPQTSSIQPERFRGYHTGADAEYSDIITTVPVHAIQNGTVVYSGYVSGYGGVIVLTGNINNQAVRFLYGHLNPSQLLPINTTVSAGQQIGILGKGYSNETDFERRHLHFAIIKGTKIDFRGYVQDKNELVKWLDPLLLNYQTLK